jgi:uncharacterized membrane protein (DUF4010 family)
MQFDRQFLFEGGNPVQKLAHPRVHCRSLRAAAGPRLELDQARSDAWTGLALQNGAMELPAHAIEFAVALGVGLLIGVERELRKGSGPERAAAGVRTFVLLALAGALAQWLGPAALLVAGIAVALLVFASYRRSGPADPGLTTEVAMVVTFLLGCVAMRVPAAGAGLGVLVAIVLYSKSKLHPFVREQLTAQEMHDLLMLAAAAFVVLPLLPEGPVDPWGAIDLRRLWILVVAMMSVSSAGYVALRWFGPRLGLPVAGFAGGFVSSTATVAAMADLAKSAPTRRRAFASAALASNVGTIVQLAVVLGALAPPLLRLAALPLVAAGAVAVVAALVSIVGSGGGRDGDAAKLLSRPFEPRKVLGFVALLAAIMLFAALMQRVLGERSLPWVLAVTGLGDVHAAAASAAQLVAAKQVSTDVALWALLAALATNSAMKGGFAWLRGGPRFALLVVPWIALMVGAFAATLYFRP